MNKTPAVRFKGFTKDWEQRKLEDISDVRDGTHDSPVYQDEGHPFVTSKNVKNGYINFDGIQYISDYDFFEINKRSKVDINDILMGMIGTIGNLALIRTEPNFAIKNVALIKDTKNVSYLYLYHYLKSSNIERQLLFGMDGGTQKFVSLKKIRELKIQIPDDDEQIKLGTFMESLDNLIVFYQRKYEKLVNIKKSMLYKMFPQNGSKVPEIRFTGFTDDWEQRKVSEITSFHKQGFYTTETYNEKKKYYLLRGTDMTGNRLILKDTPKINATESDYKAFKAQVGDFLIVRSGTVGTYGIVYEDIPAIFGSYLIDFRFDKSQVTNEFFGYFYQSDLFTNQLRQIIQQSANTNINAENIKSTSIKIPSIPEQNKIGKYFSNLDNLIALYQRKLEKLKQIKQAMLHKMFV